jgi:prephenate dehydrogenase
MDDLYFSKKAIVGIIGLGYVGMPLALATWTEGFRVVGFDIDPQKAASINEGKSYLSHIPSSGSAQPLIEAIETSAGKAAIRNYIPIQPGDVPSTFADSSLLYRLTAEGIANYSMSLVGRPAHHPF